MGLITLGEASKFIDTPDSTIRDWMKSGKLEKHQNDKGIICVDKREVLKTVPSVVTFYNYKGGVCKTSASLQCADFYQKNNEKVLLVDFDPQANLSKAYFLPDELVDENHNHIATLYDYFTSRKSLSKIVKKFNENIDILPARLDMMEKAGIKDFDLIDYVDDFYSLFKKYTIIIIDCPPSLNAFTTMGLLLAHYVMVPFVPEPFAYDGLMSVLKSMEKIIIYNKKFVDYRIVFSRIKGQKTIIHEDYKNAVIAQMNEKLIINQIPEFIGIVERQAKRENLFDLYPPERDNASQKIWGVMDEIDKIIYEGRIIK